MPTVSWLDVVRWAWDKLSGKARRLRALARRKALILDIERRAKRARARKQNTTANVAKHLHRD